MTSDEILIFCGRKLRKKQHSENNSLNLAFIIHPPTLSIEFLTHPPTPSLKSKEGQGKG